MDLDGATQEDSQAAKFMISGRQKMCVNIAIYFTTSTSYFLWGTPEIFLLLTVVLTVVFLGLLSTKTE
jgi:hypothetical protein